MQNTERLSQQGFDPQAENHFSSLVALSESQCHFVFTMELSKDLSNLSLTFNPHFSFHLDFCFPLCNHLSSVCLLESWGQHVSEALFSSRDLSVHLFPGSLVFFPQPLHIYLFILLDIFFVAYVCPTIILFLRKTHLISHCWMESRNIDINHFVDPVNNSVNFATYFSFLSLSV